MYLSALIRVICSYIINHFFTTDSADFRGYFFMNRVEIHMRHFLRDLIAIASVSAVVLRLSLNNSSPVAMRVRKFRFSEHSPPTVTHSRHRARMSR